MELPARIEAVIDAAVDRAVAEIRELLAARVAAEITVETPQAEQPAGPPSPAEPRICCECNERPALRYRFKCGPCYGRQERERRRARRTRAVSASGTEPAAPPADGADGPHAAGQPPRRRARGRTQELAGRLASPDEHDAADDRRALIASTEPVPMVDAAGRTWTVRRLPSTSAPAVSSEVRLHRRLVSIRAD